MEKKIHSLKYAKQRKFLVVLPLLTLPFLSLMFWALGGGGGSGTIAQANTKQGLNLKLPDPKFKNGQELNKLSFYQQAALDAAKTKEAEKLDPYWNKSFIDSGFRSTEVLTITNSAQDANQTKVYNKLNELKKVLSKSQEASNITSQTRGNSYSMYSDGNDVKRLESMMQKMKEDKREDPEITQLNDMLDKIQAIQNTDQTKIGSKKPTAKLFSLKAKNRNAEISLLNTDTKASYTDDTTIATTESNAFYTTTFDAADNSSFTDAIEAIIPETQTIVPGSTIKLSLIKDAVIQNITIPSGSLIYGIASLSNERLKIDVNSIRFLSSIIPVSLNVYDMDGQEGIHVPGSINRTVAQESANKSIGGINATTIDPSIGAQAASAGIETLQTLFSKKVKLIKMTVKAGYQVLLKDSNNK